MTLEALLGEEEESIDVGTAALLANRLAFMIGGSPSERADIIKTFKRLYRLRSEIVHSGKATLSDDEREALNQLREYGRRTLVSEIAALAKDPRPG